jgi:hypothetical protein
MAVTTIPVPDEYRVTSRFAPFVMRDDEDTSIDDVLYDDNWLGAHALFQAYVDALDELEHFDEKLRLVREQLDIFAEENGTHGLKKLRELALNIRGMDYRVLGPLVEEVRERGDEDLVTIALDAYRAAPLIHTLPSKERDKLAARAAAFQNLASGTSGHEAETAMRLAAETASKHKVTPRRSRWALDLDQIDEAVEVESVVRPEDKLIQTLDGALKLFRKMEREYFHIRDHGRTQLKTRIRALEQMLQNPHGQYRRQTPVVQRRH